MKNNLLCIFLSKKRIYLIIIFFAAIFLINTDNIISYLTDKNMVVNQISIADFYTITFDSNGGSGQMNSQDVFYSSEVNLLLNEFIRDGYTFIGWNTSSDGSGVSYSN